MLPKELRTRRIALGLSLAELARLAGVELPVLAAMENGDARILPVVIAVLEARERAGTVNSTQRPS